MATGFIAFIFAACSLYLASAKPTPVNIPFYDGPPISSYSGFVTVNASHGRALFYWFVESQNDPKNDPLVFWFQGGPGCSGLFGLFAELGPLRPAHNGSRVEYNPVSWTSFANVVFLEAPAGVGFSYSNTTADYNTDDFQTALDNFAFIEGFLAQWPQYRGNPTYLSGESYAGVYIPTVASVILDNPTSVSYKQLAGLSLGNPVISCASADYNAIQFNLFYWHGLVSHSVYVNWTSNGCSANSSLPGCMDIFNVAYNQIGVIYQQVYDEELLQQTLQPSLDPDNLYQDFCTGNGTLSFADDLGWPDQCTPTGNALTNYLNLPQVQKALGVTPTNWQSCSNLNYTWDAGSMIPYYRKVFSQRPDVRVLVYSGDIDVATVPFGFTKACLHELRDVATPVQPFQPWFVNGATAGYVEEFSTFTYATIKGGGHESPQYEPLTSKAMIEHFMHKGRLNTDRSLGASPTARRVSLRSQGSILRKLGIRG